MTGGSRDSLLTTFSRIFGTGRPSSRPVWLYIDLQPLHSLTQGFLDKHCPGRPLHTRCLTVSPPYAHRILTLDNIVIYGVHREGIR
jgi:hypothetical protein